MSNWKRATETFCESRVSRRFLSPGGKSHFRAIQQSQNTELHSILTFSGFIFFFPFFPLFSLEFELFSFDMFVHYYQFFRLLLFAGISFFFLIIIFSSTVKFIVFPFFSCGFCDARTLLSFHCLFFLSLFFSLRHTGVILHFHLRFYAFLCVFFIFLFRSQLLQLYFYLRQGVLFFLNPPYYFAFFPFPLSLCCLLSY